MNRSSATECTEHLVPIGEWVDGYGEVQMVGFTGGERYYWLVNSDGAVSMMPATLIEPLYKEFA